VAFENGILTLLPAAFFVLLAPARISWLVRERDCIRGRISALQVSKLVRCTTLAQGDQAELTHALQVFAVILVVLQLVLLILISSQTDVTERRLGVPAAVLDLVATSLLVGLSYFEHIKTSRPSFLVAAYLLCTLFFDVARARTEWVQHQHIAFAGVLSTSLAVKLVLLALESVEKRRYLAIPPDEKPPSTESTSGPFSRGFFVWLSGLLRTGYASLLTVSSLPAIYERLQSDRVGDAFEEEWRRRLARGRHRQKRALLWCVAHCLRWEVLQVVFPRLAYTGLQLAQPFLIREAVAFVGLPDNEQTKNLGYGLVGAFALVFICASVSRLCTAWRVHGTEWLTNADHERVV
jgi:ATP-binding cassette subfamily C (CFTR/MRP) protein 1